MNQAIDIASLGTFMATVTMIVLQTVKPLYDKLPGITLASNQVLHDNLLRALQYGINFGLLMAVQRVAPAGTFAGWQFYDFLALAIGQAGLSHIIYQSGSQGSSPLIPDTTPPPGGGMAAVSIGVANANDVAYPTVPRP